MFLYLLVGVFHIIWRVKQHRDHRSRLGFLLFIFSIVRTIALVLRLVWASHATNTNIAIAANVFTAAGVVILFIVNLIFTRRLVGDYARFGRYRALDWALRFFISCVAASIIMLIVATVYSFFTLDAHTRLTCRKIQLVGATYLAALAFVPIPAVIATMLFRVRDNDALSSTRFHAKAQLLLLTACLLSLGAGFRCGTTFDARPLGEVTWWSQKAPFYCFNFGIEIIVLYIYAGARLDPRLQLRERFSGAGIETADAPSGSEKIVQQGGFWNKLNNDREVFGGGNWQQ